MLLKLALQKFYLGAVALAILVFEATVWMLVHRRIINFDSKIDIAGLTAIPLFLIATFELYRQTAVRRANFVTEYMSKFYTEEELHAAFGDLVAGYTDEKFILIDDLVKKKVNAELKAKPEGVMLAFSTIEALQEGRKPGGRFYHPDYFQGTPEERRLDALLGYFDVIGYQYEHGLVEMTDVVGMLGYQLSMVLSRKVIESYLMGTDQQWWRSKPQSNESALVPYVYLRFLLAGFKEFNLKYKRDLQRLSDESAKKYDVLRKKTAR